MQQLFQQENQMTQKEAKNGNSNELIAHRNENINQLISPAKKFAKMNPKKRKKGKGRQITGRDAKKNTEEILPDDEDSEDNSSSEGEIAEEDSEESEIAEESQPKRKFKKVVIDLTQIEEPEDWNEWKFLTNQIMKKDLILSMGVEPSTYEMVFYNPNDNSLIRVQEVFVLFLFVHLIVWLE